MPTNTIYLWAIGYESHQLT